MKIRNTIVCCVALLAAVSFSACTKSVVGSAEVRDLVLIYDGGDHRKIDWNKDKFAPYVSTDVVDGKEQWLYDGVLFLPEPLLGQTDWGELNGKALDFNKDEDRIAACKWYIDLLIERFKEAELENVQLCGFYWLAEHVTETLTFVKAVSDYIHEKELDFYWIPYFKANEEMGIRPRLFAAQPLLQHIDSRFACR